MPLSNLLVAPFKKQWFVTHALDTCSQPRPKPLPIEEPLPVPPKRKPPPERLEGPTKEELAIQVGSIHGHVFWCGS
jgi:hypothetical protein